MQHKRQELSGHSFVFLCTVMCMAIVMSMVLPGVAWADDGPTACEQTGAETVQTDKEDYPPGDTVHVTGSGYGAECSLTISIARPDEVTDTVWAETDAEGSFFADYLLPPYPGVIGGYRIDVTGADQSLLASMEFTDASATIDIAPAYYPNSAGLRDFSVLVRIASAPANGAKCVRLQLPSGYTLDAASTATVGSGSGFTTTVDTDTADRHVTLSTTETGATGLIANAAGWARFEVKAIAPNNSNLAWRATVADNAGCSTNANTVEAGVRIGAPNLFTYTADFRDSGGTVVTPMATEGAAAQTFRLRIGNDSGSNGDKIIRAEIALPKCFTAPTNVTGSTVNGGFSDFSTPLVRDNFILLSGGELEKNQNPDHYVQVQFDSGATTACAGGATSFWTSTWKSNPTSSSGNDTFNITGSHASVTVDEPEKANLAAAKTNDTSDQAVAGDTFEWNVRVENAASADENATFAAGDTILLDELPSGPSYGSPAVTNATGISGSGTIDCDIASDDLTCTADGGAVVIGPAGGFDVAFDVPVTSDDIGTLGNPRTNGVCAADPADPDVVDESDETDNACSDSVTVAPAGPNLTADKTNDTAADEAVAGDTFEWNIRLDNQGDDDATFAAGDTILLDELPSGPSYGSPAVTNATGISGSGTIDCDIASDDLTCTADGGTVVIGPAGGFDVAFDVPVTSDDIGTLGNPRTNGVCAADPADPDVVDESDETDNACSDSVTVAPAGPNLTAEKTDDTGGSVNVDDTFDWNIDVDNTGDAPAVFDDGEMVLRDDLPLGPTYGTPVEDVTDITGDVVCTIDGSDSLICVADGEVTVGAGETFSVSFEVSPNAGGTLDNPRASGQCAADPDEPDAVDETDETDNDCTGTVDVEVLPGIVVTRGACTFDLNADRADRQFRLIYTPEQAATWSKLSASNPGQMFVNVFYFGDGDEAIEIDLPYPFVTQGANPIHMYESVDVTMPDSRTCYEPGAGLASSNETLSLGDYGTSPEFGTSTGTLSLQVPEVEGFAMIRIHVDYGLKGVAKECYKDLEIDAHCTLGVPAGIIPNFQSYLFEALGDAESLEGENVFKKDPGIGGLVMNGLEPVPNQTIRITLDGNSWTVTTDEDGWYMSVFRHKGKTATYQVHVVGTSFTRSVEVKTNGYVIVNFDLSASATSGGGTEQTCTGKGKNKVCV